MEIEPVAAAAGGLPDRGAPATGGKGRQTEHAMEIEPVAAAAVVLQTRVAQATDGKRLRRLDAHKVRRRGELRPSGSGLGLDRKRGPVRLPQHGVERVRCAEEAAHAE